MKIIKVDIPKLKADPHGLKPIQMDRLGEVVLLAGKNGAGKSRLLHCIISTLSHKPLQNNLSLIERKLKMGRAISDHEKAQLEWSEVTVNVDIDNAQSRIVRFVPKAHALFNPSQSPPDQLKSNASSVDKAGVDSLINGTLAKIQVTQNRWHNAIHPSTDSSELEKDEAKKNYEKLQNLINDFLGVRLGRNLDGEATLYGFPIGRSKLSDGQTVLLQFCLAVFSQETELKDLILFMDEPENHLHPSIIIETIEAIRKKITNGQIWIATHSIPLLAHFDPSTIWYVEDGEVKHAGRIPEKVLESLLGNDENIGKLREFISLPAQLATARYACESLIEPAVVETNASDPQSIQIHTQLKQLIHENKLRVLDFGAGKGRIISNLSEISSASTESLIGQLDYIAFDPYETDKEVCKAAIEQVYDTSEKKYFNNLTKLSEEYDEGSFQVVLMCNVLHEIDPLEWLNLFGPNGKISKLLADNSVLLLIEDQQIPTGEKAHQKGFTVLDTIQIKKLLKIKESDKGLKVNDARGDGRLKAHIVPKEYLIRIDAESRVEALKSLSEVARDRIQEIRNQKADYKNGMAHGFWVQQFANAELCLAELMIK